MTMKPTARPLRADAARNRAKVLEVAVEVFASEGLSVPIHEIARRAGVGTGTVSRHFPTKEALFEAIVGNFVAGLAHQARTLAATEEPGEAFFRFLAVMVETATVNQGLADALAGAGFDVEAAATSGGQDDVMAALRDLLSAAQRAGAVRSDIDAADAKALVVGCLCRNPTPTDPAPRTRLLAIISAALRPTL
jgi:AcrR family transcriptional regulator